MRNAISPHTSGISEDPESWEYPGLEATSSEVGTREPCRVPGSRQAQLCIQPGLHVHDFLCASIHRSLTLFDHSASLIPR
jgi:hypothetical protein